MFLSDLDPPPRRGPFSPPFSWWVRRGCSLWRWAQRSRFVPAGEIHQHAGAPPAGRRHTLSTGNLDARPARSDEAATSSARSARVRLHGRAPELPHRRRVSACSAISRMSCARRSRMEMP